MIKKLKINVYNIIMQTSKMVDLKHGNLEWNRKYKILIILINSVSRRDQMWNIKLNQTI